MNAGMESLYNWMNNYIIGEVTRMEVELFMAGGSDGGRSICP